MNNIQEQPEKQHASRSKRTADSKKKEMEQSGSWQVPHSYAARYREIIGTLAAYGFSDAVQSIREHLPAAVRRSRAAGETHGGAGSGVSPDIQKLPHYQRVRLMLEHLGPTFIKLGQMLSSRPDLVDPMLSKELEKLQDTVPPFPGEIAAGIIEEELGKPVRQLFASFDPEPVASASIAQVHKVMLNDGTAAAVKVQRPDIENIISMDIRILTDLARFSEHHIKKLSYFQPESLIEKFSEGLHNELDFEHEKDNLARFTELYGKRRNLRIPGFYPHLSSRKVFVMEFIDGIKISSIWERSGFEPQESDRRLLRHMKTGITYNPHVIADRFVSLVLEQIFDKGYFHGDPHPGNVMVLPGNKICFLDFGVMGTITGRQKEQMTNMLLAIPSRNMPRFTRSLLSLVGISHMSEFDSLMQECSVLIEKYLGGTLEDIELGSLIQDLITVITSYHLCVPPELSLLSKSLTAVEGIAVQLDPKFNILNKLIPFIQKLARNRFRPKNIFNRTVSTSLAYSEFFQSFPENIQELFGLISSGNTTVKLDIIKTDRILSTFDRIANRIVFGMVLAALLVSSAIIVFAKIPPLWNDISLLGIGGFLLSAVMGFGFVITQFIKLFKKNE